MPRSVRDSDDDTEWKGRNTRLKTRNILDSPLRRSSRLRQSQNKPSAEFSVNANNNQTTRNTRQRTENVNTSAEKARERDTRASSVPLDRNRSIDTGMETPKKNSTTGTPNKANTRAASKRMVRAISETNSPYLMRTTRRTRADSIDSTTPLNENKSTPVKTPINTRKRASALPYASPVREEIEYDIPDIKTEIVSNDEDNESAISANSSTATNNALLLQPNPELNKKRRNLFKGKFKLYNDDDEKFFSSTIPSSTETATSSHTQQSLKDEKICSEHIDDNEKAVFDQKKYLAVAEQQSVSSETQLSDSVMMCETSTPIVSSPTYSTRKTVQIEKSAVEVKQSEFVISKNSSEKELGFEHSLNSSVEEQNKNPSDKENETLNIIKDIKQSMNPTISNVISLNPKSGISPFTNKSLNEEENKPVSNVSSFTKRRHSKESIEARNKRHSLSKEVADSAKDKRDTSITSLNTNVDKNLDDFSINVKNNMQSSLCENETTTTSNSSESVSPQIKKIESVENVMRKDTPSKINETENNITDCKITDKTISNKTDDILYSSTDQSMTPKKNDEKNQNFISNDEIDSVRNQKLEKLNIQDEKEVPHNSETSSKVQSETYNNEQAVILDEHLINKSSVQDIEVDNLSNSTEQTNNLNKNVVKSKTEYSDVDHETIEPVCDKVSNAYSTLIEILDKSSEKATSKNISLETATVSKQRNIDKPSLKKNNKKLYLNKNSKKKERKSRSSDSDISFEYLFQDVSDAKYNEMNEGKKKSGMKKNPEKEERESSSSNVDISIEGLFQDVSVAKYNEMKKGKKKSGLKKNLENEENESLSSVSDIFIESLFQDVPVAKYNEMKEGKKKSGLKKNLENEEKESLSSNSDISTESLFQDIPAVKYDEIDEEKQKSNLEKNPKNEKRKDENNLTHSTLMEKPKNKDECDLILMNKQAWLVAENIKIAQKEEPFEYDSDDTVLLKSQLDALEANNSIKELKNINEESETEIDNEDDIQIKTRKSLTKRKSTSKKMDSSIKHVENMNDVSSCDESLDKPEHVLSQSNRSFSRLNKSGQAIKKTEQSSRVHSESENETEDDMERLNESSKLSKNDISLQKSTKKRSSLNKSGNQNQNINNDMTDSENSKDSSNKAEYEMKKNAFFTHSVKKKSKSVNTNSSLRFNIEDSNESDSDISVLSSPIKNSKTKFDKLGNNYSTIAQAGSDSDILGSSNTSDNEDDDHDNDNIDSDIAKEYNLKGVERKFSDNDVADDDCRASESEYSDSDDNGSDLADFIVDDDKVEDEEDEEDKEDEEDEEDKEDEEDEENKEEDEDNEEERENENAKDEEKEIENEQEESINKDDVNEVNDTDEKESSEAETNTEHIIEKLQKNRKNKIKDVKTTKSPLKRTEGNTLLDTSKSSLSNKKKRKSDLTCKNVLKHNAMEESNEHEIIFMKTRIELHKSIDSSTPKYTSDKDKFRISPKTCRVLSEAEDKNKLNSANKRIQNSSLKKQEANIKSKLHFRLSEPVSPEEYNRTRQNNEEVTLHNISLPSVLSEATRKATSRPLFSKKDNLCKTLNITHTETPTIRQLMKEKLNESAPTIKLSKQINLMKKTQSPAEAKNNAAQTTDNDKEVTNLIKSPNDLIQECKQRKHKKRKKQAEKITKENISDENLSQEPIETNISTKKKSVDSNELSVAENIVFKDTCQSSEKKKRKKKKKKAKENQNEEENIKKEEEEQKKDTKKDSNELSVAENIVFKDTCQQSSEKKKRKKKTKENQNEDENIKKEEEEQKKDTKKEIRKKNKEEKKKEESKKEEEKVQEKKKTKKQKEEKKKQVDIPEMNINQDKNIITDYDRIGQHNMKRKRKIKESAECDNTDDLSTEDCMPLKKKVKQLKAMENEKLIKSLKKKKNKEKILLSKVKPTLQSEYSEISKNVAFSKARDKALAAITRATENIRTKKRNQDLKQDMILERDIPIKQQEKQIAKKINKIPPSTSGLKRLSSDIIENLSDTPRMKKKRKIQQNEQMISSSSTSNRGMLAKKKKNRKDFISLSSSGSTTGFAVINLEKFKTNAQKEVAKFRERMLSRNPRAPTLSYLMYLEKQRATTNN